MTRIIFYRFSFLFLLLFPITASCVNNIVVYSNEQKRFTVFINGIRQNARPEANVKVTGLNEYVYGIRIEFEESVIPALTQNIYLVESCVEVTNKEFSFIVEQPFRSQWRMRVTGIKEITPHAGIVPGQAVCVFNPNAAASIPDPGSPAPCMAMTDADFANARSSVEKQMTDDSKLKVAKQVAGTNCMTTSQVKEIMNLFAMEKTKLEWAKFAYGKTTDPKNYYQLNDGFTFSSSVEELNKYIESQKK